MCLLTVEVLWCREMLTLRIEATQDPHKVLRWYRTLFKPRKITGPVVRQKLKLPCPWQLRQLQHGCAVFTTIGQLHLVNLHNLSNKKKEVIIKTPFKINSWQKTSQWAGNSEQRTVNNENRDIEQCIVKLRTGNSDKWENCWNLEWTNTLT